MTTQIENKFDLASGIILMGCHSTGGGVFYWRDRMGIPEGYCQCGCNQKTSISTVNNKNRGLVKGKPLKYVRDHVNKVKNYKGENHPQFKGRIYRRGYIYLYMPSHPKATKQGYIAEHRLVMESKIGRYLKSCEVVHHINEIKDDNKPENLLLFKSAGKHSIRAKHVLKNNKDGRFISPNNCQWLTLEENAAKGNS